jgi:hypothetical protein
MKNWCRTRGFSLIVTCFSACRAASAHSETAVVAGVNFVNAGRFDVTRQDAMLDAMKANGVRVVRMGLSMDDKGLDLAKRVYARGIEIVWIVGWQYQPNAPIRPWQPKAFPGMWAGPPLSYADADRTRAALEPFLARLEAEKIVLAGMEVGNEINWTAFNPEFPLPGEGKGVLSLDDLYHDPEGQRIAKGYLQYLKVLAVIKEVRDRSELNRHTPIISAGLVDFEQGDLKRSKVDGVGFGATIDFWRAHGIDQLVDGYAVHLYPPADPRIPAEKLLTPVQRATFERECHRVGSPAGKPCWITEWGYPVKVGSACSTEANRTQLVKNTLKVYDPYFRQGRIAGFLYYCWNSDAWATKEDPYAVYRNGSLTAGGRLAVAPILVP